VAFRFVIGLVLDGKAGPRPDRDGSGQTLILVTGWLECMNRKLMPLNGASFRWLRGAFATALSC
jgi:hypothetical protein